MKNNGTLRIWLYVFVLVVGRSLGDDAPPPEGSLNESFPILIQILGNITNSTNSTDGEDYSYSYGNGSSIVYEYDDAFYASGDKASSSSSRHGKMVSGGDKKYGNDEQPNSSTGSSKGGKKGPKKDDANAIESKGSGKGKKATSGDYVGHHGKMTKTSGEWKYNDDEVKGSYDASEDTARKGAKSKTGGSSKDDKSYGPHGDDDNGNDDDDDDDDDSDESHISNDEVGSGGKGKHSRTKKQRESDDRENEHYQQARLSIRSSSHVGRGLERVWTFLSVVNVIGLFT